MPPGRIDVVSSTATAKANENDSSSQLGQILRYGCLEMIDLRVSPQGPEKRSNNFTIEYILRKEETKNAQHGYSEATKDAGYDWLTYTRYKPPKLQRIRKKECISRRRSGRNPRIPFSSEQVMILERKFRTSPYLSNTDVVYLSKCLQLSESRIKIWFQNRRARERRDGQDSSKKDLNLIKNFLLKTRHSEVISDDVQDLSMSAFKPCHKLLQ